MKGTLETPDEMLERLDRMGLDRVKSLLTTGHFERKTLGLVHGWVQRKEEEKNPPAPPAPSAEELAQEALKTARLAVREARKMHAAAVKTRRTATIALALSGVGILLSILTLFAFAIR